MGTLVFFTILCVVLGVGVCMTVSSLVRTQNQQLAPTPKKESIYLKPKTPYEHGRRDMLAGVCEIMYSGGGKQTLGLIATSNNDPVQYLADTMYKHRDYSLDKYKEFSLNNGRTSKMFMTASNGVDFEHYIKGGRELIDDLDKALAILNEQDEIVEARKYGLEDSDNFHKLSRKELRKLQNRNERIDDDTARFEKQMKEIEDGK